MTRKLTAAEKAYRAAQRQIEKVRKAGGIDLNLNAEAFRALEQIPPEVADLAARPLLGLNLEQTRVSDLSPIAALTGLKTLFLDQTSISDLSPIAALTGLASLSFNETGVIDLSPIAALTGLETLSLNGTGVSDLSPIAALTGLKRLYLDQTQVSDLSPVAALTELETLFIDETRVNDLSPVAALSRLESLTFSQTGVSELSPISDLTGLKMLFLNQTGVSDLSPIAALTGLELLALSRTVVGDLRPIAALTRLTWLSLHQTGVSDLRPILALRQFGAGEQLDLNFKGTTAVLKDKELARLSEIENSHQRSTETLAYLNTLPPWPEPLPWLVEEPPLPDPAMPLRSGNDGISLAAAPITEAELDDPIRATLFDALSEQTSKLIHVSGNIDEATYSQACKLRDLMENGLHRMNPLLVHLSVEALRRTHRMAESTDRDYLLALEAVIETGPGLTLDTVQVQLFINRAQRNRLERLAEAQAEAQIRLARSIAESDLTAPDLKSLAIRAADDQVYDQFTAIRPTLGRNYVIEVGKYTLAIVAAIPIEYGALQAWQWLAINADDIRVMSVVWGEPFAAWIAPILDRAHMMVEGSGHLGRAVKNRVKGLTKGE